MYWPRYSAKPEPASDAYPQNMPVRENDHIALGLPRAFHSAVRPLANILWRFPSRTSIASQLPISAVHLNVSWQAFHNRHSSIRVRTLTLTG